HGVLYIPQKGCRGSFDFLREKVADEVARDGLRVARDSTDRLEEANVEAVLRVDRGLLRTCSTVGDETTVRARVALREVVRVAIPRFGRDNPNEGGVSALVLEKK